MRLILFRLSYFNTAIVDDLQLIPHLLASDNEFDKSQYRVCVSAIAFDLKLSGLECGFDMRQAHCGIGIHLGSAAWPNTRFKLLRVA